MPISTQDLSLLLDIPTLQRLSQSLALLDAILYPEWQYRYYSFNSHWRVNQRLALMRNGEGDWYICFFSPVGAILKGFDHESRMSPFRFNPPRIWAGVLDNVPSQFKEFLSEPAFVIEETTFCIWRTYNDTHWQRGDIQFPDGKNPDGSAMLLSLLDGNPQAYQQWAGGYYECPVSLPAIIHIYQHKPLTDSLITSLNPDLSLQALQDDLTEIGYGQPLT